MNVKHADKTKFKSFVGDVAASCLGEGLSAALGVDGFIADEAIGFGNVSLFLIYFIGICFYFAFCVGSFGSFQ